MLSFNKILLLGLIGSFCFYSFAQEKYELKQNPKQGQEHNLIVEIDTDSQAEGQDIGVSVFFKMRSKVQEVKADSYVNENTVERIKFNMKSVAFSMNYDSDSLDTSDPFALQLNNEFIPMIGKKYAETLDFYGEVLEADYSQLGSLAEQMSDGNDKLKFPKEPLSIGEGWEEIRDKDSIIIKTFNTLKKVSAENYQIEVTGEVLSKKTQLSIGTIGGHYYLDPKTLFMQSFELEMDMTVQETPVKVKIVGRTEE